MNVMVTFFRVGDTKPLYGVSAGDAFKGIARSVFEVAQLAGVPFSEASRLCDRAKKRLPFSESDYT